MSKINFEVKDNALNLGVDSNEDGEPLLKLKLNLTEGMQEIMNREAEITGAKVVDFSFSGTKLKLKLDTDKDGEALLELELDLMEGFDEAKDLIL